MKSDHYIDHMLYLFRKNGYDLIYEKKGKKFDLVPIRGKIKEINFKEDLQEIFSLSEFFFKEKKKIINLLLVWFLCLLKKNKVLKDNELNMLGILPNISNSCYQDVILTSLFYNKNKFIFEEFFTKPLQREKIFCSKKEISNVSEILKSRALKNDLQIRREIRQELYNLSLYIRKKPNLNVNCKNLRSLIKDCQQVQKHTFHTAIMQDAGEFLIFLFNLFNVEGVEKVVTTVVKENKNSEEVIAAIRSYNSSPVIHVPFFKMNNPFRLSDMIQSSEVGKLDKDNLYRFRNKLYSERKQIETIVSAKYLVFNLQRTYIDIVGNEKRNKIRIIPEDEILNLDLTSIVIHKGLHYTCYLNIKGMWFYYDDTRTNLKFIGTLSQVFLSSPDPAVYSTLFFYS